MIPKSNSQFVNDMISMDVLFEQIRAWVRTERDLSKKEIIEFMKRIKVKAEIIELRTKGAGWDYFGGKDQ